MADRSSIKNVLLRRVLPLVVLVVVASQVVRLFEGGPGDVTIAVELGAAARGARSLTIEVFRDEPGDAEPVAVLRRNFDAAGARRAESHVFQLGDGTYRLVITVELDGTTRRVTRTIEAEDDKTVPLDIEAELLGE